MSRFILEGKLASESRKETFDFLSRLASGETISSAAVTATVYAGTDASPSSIISGSAAIAGSQVTQLLVAGVAGVTYLLSIAATTSASQVLQQEAFLTIVPLGA